MHDIGGRTIVARKRNMTFFVASTVEADDDHSKQDVVGDQNVCN